ncbi:hypothetical protein FB45DRAFT_938763 [Roridomyces roridus]|uniref:F-box domain-containing protein n=1 Tax=Roridomyces roridus TaxID=1738132 RepID=A0AAD7FD29_9AGAR|nr:hypothetical protein FB45DRAFT_938763 [Roridomyces roridus]
MARSLLHSLPVELVLIVLRGSSLADILNLSRTCRYLRSICLTNRSVWLAASDAYKLSLPLGETLKTTPLASLLRNSARSVSIESKWRSTSLPEPGAAATPTHIRSSELTHLYDLPVYAFWSPRKYGVPSLLGHAPPTYMNVLPGGRSFLLGSSAHLGVYDLEGKYGVQLEVPYASGTGLEPWPGRGVPEVDWYSGNNGVQTTIVVLSMAFDEEREARSYLSVFTVEYIRSTRTPSVKRTHLCQLPFHATQISVKGSRVLARSRDTVAVMSLEGGQRAQWTLPDIDCEITCTAMHEDYPNSVFLVVKSATAGRSLQVIDIPLSDNTDGLDWSHLSCPRRMIHPAVVEPASKFPASSLDESMEFSMDGGEMWFHETVLVDPHTLGVSTALVTLGPSSVPVSEEIPKEPSPFRVIAQNLASASVHVERSAYGGRQVLARKLDETGGLVVLCCGSDERLEISVPASMVGFNTKSMVFDEVYGILLVFVRGRVCVVRY